MPSIDSADHGHSECEGSVKWILVIRNRGILPLAKRRASGPEAMKR